MWSSSRKNRRRALGAFALKELALKRISLGPVQVPVVVLAGAGLFGAVLAYRMIAARFTEADGTTEQDFDRTYAVNARGTFFCIQEALRHLGDGGRIVCISTIGTLLNLPGGACYFGAKAAVEQFCRVAAREVAARGITINTVSPGFIDTDMLRGMLDPTDAGAATALVDMAPLARLGEGRDIAGVVSFLVGPDGAWMTRQNLAVDGGIVSR